MLAFFLYKGRKSTKVYIFFLPFYCGKIMHAYTHIGFALRLYMSRSKLFVIAYIGAVLDFTCDKWLKSKL